jgi:sigma-B regulation protein RsbU (phosphoserine phosphatase)
VFAEANGKITAASGDIMLEGGNMMFVTVLAGVLDLATGRLMHASAGHDAPYMLLRPGAPPEALTTVGGPPLGAVDDFPFIVDEHRMSPGELLVLYTDGVTEAEDAAQRFYSVSRLEQVFAAARPSSARAAVETVREDLRRFVGAAEQTDDITLLAVRWLGPAA